MTDAELATRFRALADDYHDPLSVPCVQCRSTGGDACVAVEDQEEPLTMTGGAHPVRRVDAKFTAESHTRQLLRQLGGS